MQKVRVLAVASFENVRKGDMGLVDLTPRIKGIIESGYLRVVEDVPLPAGQSGGKSRKPRGSEAGVDGGWQASPEPIEDSDSGEHWEAPIV